MAIQDLNEITPNLENIEFSTDFQESLIGFNFSENVKSIFLTNYSQSLIGVNLPENLQILRINTNASKYIENLETILNKNIKNRFFIIVNYHSSICFKSSVVCFCTKFIKSLFRCSLYNYFTQSYQNWTNLY